MNPILWSMIGWIVGASILGFAISAIFAGWMKLSRSLFLIPYVFLVTIFIYMFISINNINVAAILRRNWIWGIVAGLVLSILLVRNIKSQPYSRQVGGAKLALDFAWAGFAYGFIDGLFLSVMPVIAVSTGASSLGWTSTLVGMIGVGALGLLASLIVTAAYHLGYPEFHGAKMRYVLLGNGLITLAFLVSGNPLGSLLSHPIMHIAAVLQGAETTLQLPPHYQVGIKAS
jgi:hypothetical protein